MENQEQKENYQQKIQSQLDEWRADIDRLKEKAKKASSEGKQKYQESIDKLELKMTEGRSKLKDLKESTDDAWDSIKEGADSIWDTMKATFSEVKEKFRDKDEEKE
jgi:chromosome segregation ATPase